MNNRKLSPQIPSIASDLLGSLARGDRQSSIHLARLILADGCKEGSAYRSFARALARQLQHWTKGGQAIREDDVLRMLKAAACELVAEHWED